MTTLSLTDPSNGTVADANTIVSNNSAIKAVVNGNIDNANVAAAAALSVSKLAAGASGQVVGMLAGTPTWLGGMAQLADSTAGGAVASFDFSSIPATYAHLVIVLYGRSDNATGTSAQIRMNNDSAANYDDQYVDGSGATATASSAAAATSGRVSFLPGADAGASRFVTASFTLSAYTGTTAHKIYTGTYCSPGAAFHMGSQGGIWKSTVAVNRITIFPGAGNFIAGSRCTLYGLG